MAGMSLSGYLLAEIRRLAERPTMVELRERLRLRSRIAGAVSAAEAVRRAGRSVIVLDASAAIECLLQTPAGLKVDKRISSPSESHHTPHLLDVEVAQVLWRYVRDKTITSQRGGKKPSMISAAFG